MSWERFDPEGFAAVAIGLAVAVGVIRLVLWRRSAPIDARTPRWRLGLLAGLQLVAGVLLHLVLFPPSVVVRTGTLVAATEGAPRRIALRPGEILVALPEAGPVDGATRVPDLATAVRRFPAAADIRLVGDGLAPRDQAPLPIPLSFSPSPPPPGLIDLAPPGPAAPGAVFFVGGRVGGLDKGTVELVDPANLVVARAPAAAGGRFVLSSSTRAPSLAVFSIRLRDGAGRIVEQAAVPVETVPQLQPHVLVLAGAPDPETKFLRRWAQDSGIELSVQIEVGGGVEIGDAPVALTPGTLGEIDLVVVDDRRWETLGPTARATLASAVDGGLGLLLRPTGALSASTRRDWAALGLPLSEDGTARPLQLPPASTRRPDGGPSEIAEPPPELTRRIFRHEGPRAVSILREADGVALASWRARGRGRIGVWTVVDSYALVLTGRVDLYAELWSELFSVLARPGQEARPQVGELARAGARVAVCGLSGQAQVLGPGDDRRTLSVDPATGEEACAAFWPERSGWHMVRDADRPETPFYVHAADAAPSLAMAANRRATLSLASRKPQPGTAPASQDAPGSPWPWFLGLLAVLGASWWLERNRPAPQRARSDELR